MKQIYLISCTIIAIGIAWHLWSSKQQQLQTRSANTLIVGTNATYAPFTFKQQGIIVGLDIDIIHEVAKRMGKEIVLKDLPYDALITELLLDKISVIAAGMTPTPQRAQKVFFARPHLTGEPFVIVSPVDGPCINAPEDLRGKTVIVNTGYTYEGYAAALPGVSVQRVDTTADAFLALTCNRGDAFITARTIATPFFAKYGTEKFHMVPIANTAESYALAVSNNEPILFEEMQHALDAMEQDGTLEQIKQKWGL